MAANDGSIVHFKPGTDDPEAGTVALQSPAKNRANGKPLAEPLSERRKSSIPILFERSAHSWWNPRFDSKVLEAQHQKTSFPNTKRKFQYALGYVVISCIVWCIFFGVMGHVKWSTFLAGSIVLLCIALAFLIFSFTVYYQRVMMPTSIILLLILCLFVLLSFIYDNPRESPMSAVGMFTSTVAILLMMYTLIPLPLYLCIGFGACFSIAYEILSAVLSPMNEPHYIAGRALLHFGIHIIGIHLFIMAQVRRRSTFLKVGQSILSRRDLGIEKQLKQKMINSLMPQQVAEEVMKQRNDNKEDEDDDSKKMKKHHHHHNKSPARGIITFRSFHMSQMDNVSILFADIVGFTKMSSNKTAEHLVSLLNDLFGRFDILCKRSGCEKICTLGDCYYCVSGCPEARADHAKCCVEMGLAMCIAIKEFDEDHNEAVNMRVGVHTGTVLCGIVGTRRFKFDVWSHDVTLANTMESEGKPGCVHISDSTYNFIKDDFNTETGAEVEDIRKHKVLIEDYNAETQQYVVRHVKEKKSIKTYFITGRKESSTTHLVENGAESIAKSGVENNTAPVSSDEIRIVVSAESDTPDSREVSQVKEESSVSPDNHNPDSAASATPTNHLGDKQTKPSSVLSHHFNGLDPELPPVFEEESLVADSLRGFAPNRSSPIGSSSSVRQSYCKRNSELVPENNRRSVLSLKMPSSPKQKLLRDKSKRTRGRNNNLYASVQPKSMPREPGRYNPLSGIIFLKPARLRQREGEESTAVLLGKRDNLATSLEDLNSESRAEESGRAGLVGLGLQLQTQRHLHAETDNQLIVCMKEDANVEEYLYSPPINKFSLNFLNRRLETKYRADYVDDSHQAVPTFALPHYSTLCDMIVSFLFFIAMAVCCFLGFGAQLPWVIVFVLALLVEVIIMMPVFCDVCCRRTNLADASGSLNKLGRFLSRWVPRHIFGCIIASLPAVSIYANFSCSAFTDEALVYYCLLLVASLLHYCNFTMLSSWLKSSLATVAGILLLVLLGISVCRSTSLMQDTTTLPYLTDLNGSTIDPLLARNTTLFDNETYDSLKYEIIPNIALLLLLVWFLNREFEISYRVCFHGDVQAAKDKETMQSEKEQADWLLHNIIPEHVSEVLKQTSQYCKNHKDVGVIFAKIVNYDDFYDESFEGGKEYLRVLNELIGDFEDLFDNQKYKDVEKIKTIGACLMAASGLNPLTRNQNKNPNAHLYSLVDFSLGILDKLEQFNSEIFNFDFEMAIGFNYGEVTAGVIGTTKLLYDIWGDTVNVSSRMYSTGVSGKIQVTEDCAKKLEDVFDFEYRGQIYVKGKGDLNTYILKGKKPGATWD